MHQEVVSQARNAVLTASGLPGVGSQMGSPCSVFESIGQQYQLHRPQIGWPSNVEDRQNLVIYTRRVCGLDWRCKYICDVDNHSNIEASVSQDARTKDPGVFVIQHGLPQSLQQALDHIFASGSCLDLNAIGDVYCAHCSDSLNTNMCTSRLLPWTAENGPDRIFIASMRVDHESLDGSPARPSSELNIGALYGLVCVVYHISFGNHFVSQFRSRGMWRKIRLFARWRNNHRRIFWWFLACWARNDVRLSSANFNCWYSAGRFIMLQKHGKEKEIERRYWQSAGSQRHFPSCLPWLPRGGRFSRLANELQRGTRP